MLPRRLMAIAFVLCVAVPPVAALPGIPDCPEGEKEMYVLPYARDVRGLAVSCVTFVQCLNVSRQAVPIRVQFFNAGTGTQVGLDARVGFPTPPGQARLYASSTPDPSEAVYYGAAANSAYVLGFQGFGRVCAGGKISCEAFLACSGPSVTSLRIIAKRQKGD